MDARTTTVLIERIHGLKAMNDKIYRGLTAAEIEREYDARATVGGDIEPFVAAYRDGTQRARATLQCRNGVPYGSDADAVLDIYFPPQAQRSRPVPALIFLHGGYWRMLGTAESGFMAEAMAAAGIATVVVNYSLAPKMRLPEIVRQCRAAVAWVHASAGELGIDAARLHISGSSAGGHLAGMMLAPGWQRAHGVPDDVIKSASLFSGLYDLEPLRFTQVNGWMHLDEEMARAMSPMLMIPTTKPRLVLAVGANETSEFRRQTRDYMMRCMAAGCPAQELAVPGTNHFDIVMELAHEGSAIHAAVVTAIR